MTEREIIIEGLERRQRFKTPDGSSCVIPANLLQDALALLKAQEPRVMTLEEVESTIKELAPLWVELRLNDGEDRSGWRMGWTDFQHGKPKKYMMENYNSGLTLTKPTHGKFWRCWTSKPTDAQREATPWSN